MSQLANLSVQEQQFLATFQQAIETQSFDRLIFSQYKGELEQLEKINLRVILLQNEQFLSCLYKYKTQDVTKNFPIEQAMDVVVDLLNVCKQANLITSEQELQLKKNKKKVMLSISKNKPVVNANEQQGHDRAKHRFVEQNSQFLQGIPRELS